MLSSPLRKLPAREREIATLVFARGEASAVEITRALAVPISNSAVRSMLRRLEKKGVLKRRREGHRFIYLAASPEAEVRRTILQRVASEHFGGSLSALITEASKLAEVEQSHR